MALPEDFSPAEHLQDTILKVQNKIVRAEFSDIGDDDWEPNISTPRASLRIACTHQESDSLLMTHLRNQLFYEVLRKCKDFHPNIYGIPSQDFQEVMTFYPQVELYFQEKTEDVEKGYDPIRARIKFRLVGETSEGISKAEATSLATKIKANFAASSIPFSFKKGRELWTYTDQSKGYFFQLYVFAEAEAKKVITEVMQLRSHTPDWKLLNSHISDQPTEAYPIIPPTKTILGKPTRQPRKRPAGTVYYRYSLLYLYGRSDALVLHDLTGFQPKPLVR